MTLRNPAILSALCVALVTGFAMNAAGSPVPREAAARDAPIAKPPLDRAALFRPAQVGECGAVKRQREIKPVARERVRGQRPQNKTAAAYGCDVVWTD